MAGASPESALETLTAYAYRGTPVAVRGPQLHRWGGRPAHLDELGQGELVGSQRSSQHETVRAETGQEPTSHHLGR